MSNGTRSSKGLRLTSFRRFTLWSAVTVIALAGAVPVLEGDAAELEAVLGELRELRRGYYAERDDVASEIDAVNRSVVVFRRDVSTLTTKSEKLKTESEAVRVELESLRREVQAQSDERARVLAAIKSLAPVAAAHVSTGIPYRVDSRMRMVEAFAETDSLRDAFARMWSFCEEELRASRSGETYTDEISLPDGRIKNARFGRVGLQVLGFTTEDGRDVGIWKPGTGWSLAESPATIEAVRTTIEILDRRRGPEFVGLPVQFEGGVPR